MGQHERTGLIESAGVVATACRQRRPVATREIPTAVYGQPATRESRGVAERSVLPMKPGREGKTPVLMAEEAASCSTTFQHAKHGAATGRPCGISRAVTLVGL